MCSISSWENIFEFWYYIAMETREDLIFQCAETVFFFFSEYSLELYSLTCSPFVAFGGKILSYYICVYVIFFNICLTPPPPQNTDVSWLGQWLGAVNTNVSPTPRTGTGRTGQKERGAAHSSCQRKSLGAFVGKTSGYGDKAYRMMGGHTACCTPGIVQVSLRCTGRTPPSLSRMCSKKSVFYKPSRKRAMGSAPGSEGRCVFEHSVLQRMLRYIVSEHSPSRSIARKGSQS
jgi:hypothetical protein